MSKSKNKDVGPEDTMRAEYDFTGGIRGKYAKRFSAGTNIVLLDPDIAAVFPDSASVNDALRALARIARQENSSTIPSI